MKPDEDNLDLQFLIKARGAEVLTAFVVQQETLFRFRHDRIFRFVVTSFLYRQHQTLEIGQLHDQLTKGQDKIYWSDVVEFWGEFLSEEAIRSAKGIAVYKHFMIAVGNFEPAILKQRLIYQWTRLSTQHPLMKDPDFDLKLLLILTQNNI